MQSGKRAVWQGIRKTRKDRIFAGVKGCKADLAA
jgi:hypothetical protein